MGVGVLGYRIHNDPVTGEHGPQCRLTNKTGANSVKGMPVEVYDDTAIDNAFDVGDADGNHTIGIVAEDAIADGAETWLWSDGAKCLGLLKDATASTRGFWVKTSDVAGRLDMTNAAPPGGGVAGLDEHFQEVGHCLASEGADTDVLAMFKFHNV